MSTEIEKESGAMSENEELHSSGGKRLRRIYSGMWGIPEIVCVSLASISLLIVLLFYVLAFRPASARLHERKVQLDRIETELRLADAKFGNIKNTESQVDKVVASIGDFEGRFLRFEATGRTSLYQRLNTLIVGYGLVNTSGPDYISLTLNQQNGEKSEAGGRRDKFQSLFPGVYVSMTVEGPYQNIRRFLRELETSGDFIVLSNIELQAAERQKSDSDETLKSASANVSQIQPGMAVGSTTIGAQESGTSERPGGKTRGEIVSLRLEMAAYFRRGAN